MATVVVFGTVALAVAFTLAWALSPELREWIERPKHGFADSVRRFDQARGAHPTPTRRTP